MPDFSDPTAIRPSDPEPLGATVVRPAPTEDAETRIRASTAAEQPDGQPDTQPVAASGSSGFSEETRQLLRKRLLVTHGAIGIVTVFIVLLSLAGTPLLPCETGLG